MGGASSYIAILCIAAFLSAAWLATKFSQALGISSIVLEITTGVVLGPSVFALISDEYAVCEHKRHAECHPENLDQLLRNDAILPKTIARIAGMDYCDPHNWDHHVEDHVEEHHYATGLDDEVVSGIPGDVHTAFDAGHRRRLSGGGGGAEFATYAECLEKSCESDVSHHCGLTPDVFTLIGHAGVALMIFESGMHFDFEKARVVGPKACCVAVFGTILPLITGMILTVLYGKPVLPDAISVGTALAPTSVGIALRLLGEAGVLSHDFGQAIITAAFVDDILSLILFNVLFSLKGDFDFVKVVVFPIVGIVFMGIAMVAAVKFWPRAINDWILPRIPVKSGEWKVSSSDEALFLIMFMLLIAYGTATHFLGTHLWGCFIAGMSFACVKPMHHPHHVWVKQTKRMTSWMIRIFFAATVAFSIPVEKLLSLEAFLKGSLMGIGPCILTKVLCAPFMGDAKFVIGWAMVGRAEFAYLIAQMAAAADMIDEETFSITIWALLYATIFAPFIFRTVLKRYIARNALETGPPTHEWDGESSDEEFKEHVDDEFEIEAAKKKLANDSEGSLEGPTYGKSMPELEEIKLEVDRAQVRRRQPGNTMGNRAKGFLCCLLFNKANHR